MNVLVVAEIREDSISQLTLAAITAASKIGEVTCLVVGSFLLAKEASRFSDVACVLHVSSDVYEHGLAEPWAALIAEKSSDFTHLIMASSSFSKNVLPRAAALVEAEPISDVIQIHSPTRFVRPIYAGDILETVESHQPCLFLTIRATAFDKATLTHSESPIYSFEPAAPQDCRSTFVSEKSHTTDRPQLASASIVFAGGRGLQTKANFERLEKIAEKYQAAVGASRAAVDAEMAPNDWQVGQTGQIVAPVIYVAIGISGATQHVAGMKDSKIVIAVNKDPEAPIFSIADYGLVADADSVLSALESCSCNK